LGLRTGLVALTTSLLLVAPSDAAAATDNRTPTLVSFAVEDRVVGVGGILTIDYEFADDTSTALSLLAFEFADEDGTSRPLFVLGAVLAGRFTVVVPGDWPAGAYTLASVYAADTALNRVQYLRNGRTALSPVTTSGPSAHGFDLTAGDLTVEARAPGPPLRVSARAGDGAARVRWSEPPANGSPLTGYVVRVRPVGRELSVPADATSVEVDGLANGTAYTFTVRATNAIGTSPISLATSPVTPTGRPGRVPKPKVAVKSKRVVVRWGEPADGGSPLTGYRVVLDGRATEVPSDRRRFSDRLRPGRHRVRVLAVNELGRGEPSRIATFRVRRGSR